MNRKQLREHKKQITNMTVKPEAATQMTHPMLLTLTPKGKRVIAERRKKNKAAKQARKRNR